MLPVVHCNVSLLSRARLCPSLLWACTDSHQAWVFSENTASHQVISCAETFHHQAILAPLCVSTSLELGFTASSYPAIKRGTAETPLQKGVSAKVLPKGSSKGISLPDHVASSSLLCVWAICDPCPGGTGRYQRAISGEDELILPCSTLASKQGVGAPCPRGCNVQTMAGGVQTGSPTTTALCSRWSWLQDKKSDFITAPSLWCLFALSPRTRQFQEEHCTPMTKDRCGS